MALTSFRLVVGAECRTSHRELESWSLGCLVCQGLFLTWYVFCQSLSGHTRKCKRCNHPILIGWGAVSRCTPAKVGAYVSVFVCKTQHNVVWYFDAENIIFDENNNNFRGDVTEITAKKEAHCTKSVNIESLDQLKRISHRKQAAHETWMWGCAVTLRADTYLYNWNRYSASWVKGERAFIDVGELEQWTTISLWYVRVLPKYTIHNKRVFRKWWLLYALVVHWYDQYRCNIFSDILKICTLICTVLFGKTKIKHQIKLLHSRLQQQIQRYVV